MKAAILGAGISGLSCAVTLKKHGINPIIIEKRHHPGEPYSHAIAMLQIMNRPIKDPLIYLSERAGITIQPSGCCKKITMHGPSTSSTVTGDLGYFFIKGNENQSVDYQLLGMFNSPIYFDTHADIAELEKEYDYVVVATGTHYIAENLGCWQNIYESWVHGATVLGNFDPQKMDMWLNTNYCKSGYAYLIPFDCRRAALVLITPDTTRTEMQYYWDLFLAREKINYAIVDTFEQAHVAGYCYPHKIRNILFVGNSGGFMEPFLGFAFLQAIVTGVKAADSIASGSDYEDNVTKIAEHSQKMISLRKGLNKLENKDLDYIVTAAGLPGVNTFFYNSNIKIIDYLSKVIDVILNTCHSS